MTTTYTPAYLAEAIADEVTLAGLMGWRNLDLPKTQSAPMWGMHDTLSNVVYGTKQEQRLPMWRRSWAGAGELIGRCEMGVLLCADGVLTQLAGDRHFSFYASHPTKDDAIRAAICKAAIAYLTAERDARVPA